MIADGDLATAVGKRKGGVAQLTCTDKKRSKGKIYRRMEAKETEKYEKKFYKRKGCQLNHMSEHREKYEMHHNSSTKKKAENKKRKKDGQNFKGSL